MGCNNFDQRHGGCCDHDGCGFRRDTRDFHRGHEFRRDFEHRDIHREFRKDRDGIFFPFIF